MDTLRQFSEYTYYDLQELSFIPGLPDEDRAWVEKVLTLGHPEDWSARIDYTKHVYVQKRALLEKYLEAPAQELYHEYRAYVRQENAERIDEVPNGRWNWWGEADEPE